MKSTISQRQLSAENAALRTRLEEAEESLRAIRSGEVDAVFVTGISGERLLTLQGADVYQTLIEEMHEGALTMTSEGVILYANRSFAAMLKLPLEKVIGATLEPWVAPESQRAFQVLLDKGIADSAELRLIASAGTSVATHVSVNRLELRDIPDVLCLVITDLTEHKRIEAIAAAEKLTRELLAAANQSRHKLQSVIEDLKQAESEREHANRALSTLSEVSRTLVHSANEDQLFQRICRAIVRQPAYQLAWVGDVQHDDQKSINVLASAGDDHGYLELMQHTWADKGGGNGPSGRAVRHGTTQFCQDIASDQDYLTWGDEALQRGYAATISFPLKDAEEVVFGLLSVYASDKNAFSPDEIALLEQMAGDMAFGVRALKVRQERDLTLAKNRQQVVELQENLGDTMRAVARIGAMRDPYTAGHQTRVAGLAREIATQMRLPKEQIRAIHLAATVHDLGKIQTPAEILSKPGALDDAEFMLIQRHSQAGYDILKDIKFPWPIAQIVLQHHERLDGSGYPQGLKGDAILLEALILGVADVVEAMSSHRPYRAELGIEAALDFITAGKGTLFDAKCVDICIDLFHNKSFVFL